MNMKKAMAKILDIVERESYNLEDKTCIFIYALLNIHARDG